MANTTDVQRITGLLILEVRKSNPNGDPERESAPRQRPDGKGEISPVSVKRKLRDLVLDKEGVIWGETTKAFKPALNTKRFDILEARGRNRAEITKQLENKNGGIGQAFIDAYWDGRLFGNTFLEEGGSKSIRTGVAHFGVGVSIAPIEIETSTWTNKSGVQEGKDRGMAPMAFKVVKHALYAIPFFVNPNLAHKTGCTKQDVDLMLNLIKYAYSATRSVVRTMVDVIHVHTFTHNSQAGSLSDFALLDALAPQKNTDADKPSESIKDYTIPTWKDIENKLIRDGALATFAQSGTYLDYAFEQPSK
jgi:Cas7 group CRISPR-associated protein Csh2